MGVFNQEQKQNIRRSYGDTDVWNFIQTTINHVLGDELEHLRVTNQGILYEVFRITDYVMGEHTYEEKVYFCRKAFEEENERVNEYSNETAGRTEIQITTYLIVHLATVLLCAKDEYSSYALEILNSCYSSVSSKVREKISNGVACILEEKDNLIGNKLQWFMNTYGQDGRWISKNIETMSRAQKDAPSGKGTSECVAPVFNGPVTYINENNAPFLSGIQNVTPNHLSALQSIMGAPADLPLKALSVPEGSSEEVQEQPHKTIYNNLNMYGEINYCPNGPQKDAARDSSARKDRDNIDSLRNYIFDTRLFDSDDKLNALLGEIARSIDLGEYNAIYGPNEHGRINPSAKNEWYYIFEALQESGVCRQSVGDKEFVEQMMEWFPTVFSYDTPEEMKSMTDKLRKSVSHERALWKYGESKEVTRLKDMWARRNQLGIAYEKVSRFYEIAYRGLYVRLVEMKEEMNCIK